MISFINPIVDKIIFWVLFLGSTSIMVIGCIEDSPQSPQTQLQSHMIGSIAFTYTIQEFVPDSLQEKRTIWIETTLKNTSNPAWNENEASDMFSTVTSEATKIFSVSSEGLRSHDINHNDEDDHFIPIGKMTPEQHKIFNEEKTTTLEKEKVVKLKLKTN